MKQLVLILGENEGKVKEFLENKFPLVSLSELIKEYDDKNTSLLISKERILELLEDFNTVYFQSNLFNVKSRNKYLDSLLEETDLNQINVEINGVISSKSSSNKLNESLYNLKQNIFFNNDKYLNKKNTIII